MKKVDYFVATLLGAAVLVFMTSRISASVKEDSWPRRVLITNDNGIEDIKIIELARAFSRVAETYVVAPKEDCSGSSNYLTAIRRGKLEAEPRDIGEGIQAFAVDGFPADCVLLALVGIMRESPPDLVVSGINGGPNLGQDWMFSGTVGAARVAAYAGFPAVAVSGLDSGIPGSMGKVSAWVVRLTQSRLIRELQPPGFITVSVPRISPENIKGVRIGIRAGLREKPEFSKAAPESGPGGSATWAITGAETSASPLPPNCDISLYAQGYIVIVPMIADEHSYEIISRLKLNTGLIPEW